MTYFCYRQCEQCKKTFVAKRYKTVYCGATCRQRAHRAKQKPRQDAYIIAENAVKELNNQDKQRQLKTLFLQIATRLDDNTFLGAYLQLRDRGEDARLSQKNSIVTNYVTTAPDFEDARLAFKLLAYHEVESQGAETVFSAIEDLRSWLNQIEDKTLAKEFSNA